MVVGFHHVQVAMPKGGERAAEGFYAGVLRMRRLPKPDYLDKRRGCWFACDESEVEFHLGVEEPFVPARKAHPAFLVRSLASVRASLQAAGYEIVEDTQIEGFERFYTSDPFGNRVEILASAQ